ncbi:MAG: OmpA family protein [Saprospiraceae bacterium]|nr:OmpA family protein [Saprospiraceae bacterium]
MRNLFILASLLFTLQFTASAQAPEARNAVTGKFVFIDHYTPYLNGELATLDQMTTGMELGYTRWLNRLFNLHVPVRFGTADLPQSSLRGNPVPWLNVDATIQIKTFDNKKWLNPYLVAGIGAAMTDWNEITPQIPAGVGLNLRMHPSFYLNAQVEHRWDLTEDAKNMHYGIGGVFVLGDVKDKPVDTDGDGITDLEDKCPLIPGSIELKGCPDADGDGIADADDACPDQAGPAALKGCPDADGDGIADADDACPTEAGPAATKGCPDRDNDGIVDSEDQCPDVAGPANLMGCPDRDNDGIPDIKDKCPDVPGVAANNGCPADRDNDGVADAEDRCPDQAGPASNKGCPELKKEEKEIVQIAIQNVQFQSNSSVLTNESLPLLDQLVKVLTDNRAYHCDIAGHTDSTGEDEYNQMLSEKRAMTCYNYLVEKGISADRLTHTGFGETKPVADNSTAEGRRANRRVEFDLQVK